MQSCWGICQYLLWDNGQKKTGTNQAGCLDKATLIWNGNVVTGLEALANFLTCCLLVNSGQYVRLLSQFMSNSPGWTTSSYYWPIRHEVLMATSNTTSTRTSCWPLRLLLTIPCGDCKWLLPFSRLGCYLKGAEVHSFWSISSSNRNLCELLIHFIVEALKTSMCWN